MTDDTFLPFSFPAACAKKVTAAFDGGRITSDGGVMLLAAAERRLQVADRLAAAIRDPRDPRRVTHAMADILRARIFAIACGYEDANDLDRLRFDPAFKLACGRLPDSGLDLASQPTCSRLENLPDLRTVIRLGRVLVDLWLSSYAVPPQSITLDIDDTVDVVHGHQQLPLFNAHHDERCFLPIHIYDAATGRPVAMILRPGKTPAGKEIRSYLRCLVRMIRRVWPTTRILIRGDSHYGRAQVMQWCEKNGIDYLFGFAGNKVLKRLVEETADHIRTRRALDQKPVLRGYAETRYGAKSWKVERRVCARIEATTMGLDCRFVVTNLGEGSAEHICDVIYCARGQAETLIKMHKSQLACDRTSCRSPIANQVRLILHTAAYWLMLTMRDAVPAKDGLRKAEFATLRQRLLKIGARITETASRIRIAFAAACPKAGIIRHFASALQPRAPRPGHRCPKSPHPSTSNACHKVPAQTRRRRRNGTPWPGNAVQKTGRLMHKTG